MERDRLPGRLARRRRQDLNVVRREVGHGLIHRCEIVEAELKPERDAQPRPALVALTVFALGEIEHVCREPLLVHAVGATGLVAACHQAPILRRPRDRVLRGQTAPGHAAGQDPEVCSHVLEPVHVPPDDHRPSGLARPEHPGTCLRSRRRQEGRGEQAGAEGPGSRRFNSIHEKFLIKNKSRSGLIDASQSTCSRARR